MFVHEHRIRGIKHYRGDPWRTPDKATVVQMVRDYSPSAPIAYAEVFPADITNVTYAAGLLHGEVLRWGIDVTPQARENPYIVEHRHEKVMMAALGVDIDSPSFKLKSRVSEGASFLRSWRYGAQRGSL